MIENIIMLALLVATIVLSRWERRWDERTIQAQKSTITSLTRIIVLQHYGLPVSETKEKEE